MRDELFSEKSSTLVSTGATNKASPTRCCPSTVQLAASSGNSYHKGLIGGVPFCS